MKAVTTTVLATAMTMFLAGTAFAQQVRDGEYAGTWYRKSDGSVAATCYYVFAGSILQSWSCGRNSGTVNVKAQRGVYAFNAVHDKDGKLTGQHELRWNGSGFDGRFVRTDGKVTTSGKFARQ